MNGPCVILSIHNDIYIFFIPYYTSAHFLNVII
jgi:hypothetical protein